MRVASRRRFGFGVLAGIVAISGLSVPLLSTLAAPLLGSSPALVAAPLVAAAPSGMTLLESPAVGSLSTLGGVTGYVASQDGGDVNGWLSGQGIDPTASGPITDTTVPAAVKDQVTSSLGSDGSASLGLAADASGVNVGYAVGEAQGSAAMTVGLSNLAPVAGQEGLQLSLTTAQRLQWWNGMKWTADVTASGTAVGSIVFTWGPTGVTSTTNLLNASFASTVDQMASSMVGSFNGNQKSMLQLSNLLSSLGSVSSDSTSSVPYSFAYGVGSALAPGGSVSVKPSDVVAGSWLHGLNADQTGSGALSSMAVSSLLSDDLAKALPSLSGFDSLQGASSMADVTASVLSQLGSDGKLDQAFANAMFTQTDGQLATVGSSMNGMLAFRPMDDAAKQVLVTNVHGLVPSLLSGGWANQVAQAATGSVELKSTLDPGAVTSLVPTGVTVTVQPVPVTPADAAIAEPADTTVVEPTDTTVEEPTDAAAPEPTDATAVEPTDTTVDEPTDAAAPEPTDATAVEPTDTTVEEPTDAAAPEPTDTTAVEPTDTTVEEPTDAAAPEPTDTAVPEPTDTTPAEPADTPVAEPTDAVAAEPTDVAAPEPTDTTSEPVDTPASESTETVVDEPTDTVVPEPTDTTADEPTDATPAEPTTEPSTPDEPATEPTAPTIEVVAPVITTADDQVIVGTGDPGSVITVTDSEGTVIGNPLVDADGSWRMTTPEGLPAGTVVSATATDEAGHTSSTVQASLTQSTPTEPATPGETPSDEPTADQTPAAEPTVVETPSDEPTADQTPAAEPTVVETPAAEPTVVETPAAEPTVVETPAAEPTVVETPAAEPTVVETPAAEPTVVETP
ncbi:MAG: Ig-like domain-containing protein, partial [Propionibacteriaceae bacterium]|nr:Ig-like domain-containing protein [Propionibacteriaceae bacterium]